MASADVIEHYNFKIGDIYYDIIVVDDLTDFPDRCPTNIHSCVIVLQTSVIIFILPTGESINA